MLQKGWRTCTTLISFTVTSKGCVVFLEQTLIDSHPIRQGERPYQQKLSGLHHGLWTLCGTFGSLRKRHRLVYLGALTSIVCAWGYPSMDEPGTSVSRKVQDDG